MDKLRSLEIFLATYECGTFAAAAKSCGTDPSTVSKAIGRLESQLQLTLFQRSTRQLKITELGERYARSVRKMLQDLSVCEEELMLSNQSMAGTLRINSAVCYGHLYLRPILNRFRHQHPEIRVELELEDMHVDIIENEIDVSLRTGSLQDNRLVARRLSPMDFFLCACPSYLRERGVPTRAEEFVGHDWIGFRLKDSQQLQPIFLPDAEGHYVPFELERTHLTDDGEAMAQLCEDGFGIAQLPHFLARRGLESGALVSLAPFFRPPDRELGVFAIYPKREYIPARVRVFLDFLIRALKDQGEDTQHSWADRWQGRAASRAFPT